jgi:hypothetical protein
VLQTNLWHVCWLSSKNRRVKSDKNSFAVKMIKTFKKSLQVKGHGFTDMMSNQTPVSSRLVSKSHQDPKMPGKFCQTYRWCSTFLIVKSDHHEFLSRGQTVNKEYYIKVIKRLREVVRWPDAYSRFSQCTKPHSSHFPDSPVLAPADLLLFPKQEFTLKGWRLEPVENIHENSLAELPTTPQKSFQHRLITCRTFVCVL